MRILSLFDGISCGRLALERAGIPVEKYYASEIDKYAIQVAQKNYPDTIQIGDVTKLTNLDILTMRDVDMIIGGSPCQDLSIAKQNREGLRGARSGLFWKYVQILDVIKPKWFLLENVASMRNEDRDAITTTLKKIYPETECIMINSALVSAQQRKRYYWTNWHVEQPQDKGILLKDVLETNVAIPCSLRTREDETGKYKRLETKTDDKANSLTTVQTDSMLCMPVPEATKKGYAEIQQGDCVDLTQLSSKTRRGRSMKDKANCLTAGNPEYYQYVQPIRIGQFGKGGQGQRIYSVIGKSVCLGLGGSTNEKYAQPIRLGQIGNSGQGQRIYSITGKSVCLNANGGVRGAKTGLYKVDLPDGDYIIRKLTPVECERLQTLPDNYTAGVSNTQRYKQIGNGWTVDVIAWIFSQIPTEQ